MIDSVSTTFTYRVSHKQTGNHPLCPSVNIIRESNNYDQENQMPDGLDSCDDKALVKSLG